MAIVTYVLGACPKCRTQDAFGNVNISRDVLLRGCRRCDHLEQHPLPALKKQILYLDQAFYSLAFKEKDERIRKAVKAINRLCADQLLVCPYSSVHETETHQWKRFDELLAFIKASARGHNLRSDYAVEKRQLIDAMLAWLQDKPAVRQLDRRAAFHDNPHEWDDYFRIEVGRYIGDIELIRELKQRSVEGLVSLFDGWRASTKPFVEIVQDENREAAREYVRSYDVYSRRLAAGDFDALLDSPISSTMLPALLACLPKDMSAQKQVQACGEFLVSDHFAETPFQKLTAALFATLQLMVRDGAYPNKDRAQNALSGFFFDVRHIAAYAPYCDAIFMDKAMSEMVAKPTVRLQENFGVKVFSLTNLEAMLEWLVTIDAGSPEGRRTALAAAYPHVHVER